MFITHGLTDAAIFWIAIIVIVFMSQFFLYRERTSHHRMIETLAEKGQPIPPELLNNSRTSSELLNGRHGYGSWRYDSPIGSGIFLMCIGAGLAVFLWAMTGGGSFFDGDRVPSWLPFVGIFPFMIGLARLLAGVMERRTPK